MLGMKKQPIEEPEVIQKPSDEALEKLVYEAYAEGLHLERAPNALGIGGRDGWCFTRLPVLCHEEIYNVRVSEYFPTRTVALRELPRFLELHRRHRDAERRLRCSLAPRSFSHIQVQGPVYRESQLRPEDSCLVRTTSPLDAETGDRPRSILGECPWCEHHRITK
jgi:hypothetical protein